MIACSRLTSLSLPAADATAVPAFSERGEHSLLIWIIEFAWATPCPTLRAQPRVDAFFFVFTGTWLCDELKMKRQIGGVSVKRPQLRNEP
jgi:hypothetical protein